MLRDDSSTSPGEDQPDTGATQGQAGDGQGAQQLKYARLLIAQIGAGNIIHHGGSFWMWRGNLWAVVDDRELKQRIHRLLVGRKVTKSLVDSILDLARTEAFKPEHEFDQDKSGIGVSNGVLHWTGQAWELRPHCREDFRTACLPVAFDPDAVAPRFTKFLEQAFAPDSDCQDKIKLILEAIGYSLTTSTEFEKIFVLVGDGSNGKSVLLHVLRELAGKDSCSSIQPSQLDRLFQRAALRSKLVNIVMELDHDEKLPDVVKAIASGDVMTAERKFQPEFEFAPYSTLWFGCNKAPTTKDCSGATFRRMCIIQFNRTFAQEEKDRKLKNTLPEELPGILNLALAAYAGAISRGGFTEPQSVKDALEAWEIDNDPVRGFLAEYVLSCDECKKEGKHIEDTEGHGLVTRCSKCFTSSQEIYKAFEFYCSEAGVRTVPKQKGVIQRLKKLTGATEGKNESQTKRGLKSIRLRSSF